MKNLSHQEQLYQWTKTTLEFLPHLSQSEAYVLTLWSFGMILVRSCATTQIALFWSEVFDQPFNTCRQRLREFYFDKDKKRGKKRQELDVRVCFAPLLQWVLSLWHGERLVLALDPTSLGDRFSVLVVSVVYGQCAIPVAWRVLRSQEKGSWREEWLSMLRLLGPAVPKRMQTIVLCDRGLYARWLYEQIVALGWHPFLRVNVGGTFRPLGHKEYRKMRHICPVGGQWSGRGTAFQASAALECTLLACWRSDCKDPWLILTDLAPSQADASWYRFRGWIEQGFKVLKSGGWQWQDTHMKQTQRVERLWLAMAIATLWSVSLGEEEEEETFFPVRAFRRGHVRILVRFLNAERVCQGDLIPEEWDEVSQEQRRNIHPHKTRPPSKRKYLPQ